MSEVEIKNAIIESTTMSIERGLSLWLHLNYGGAVQGFGGYVLHCPKGWANHKIESPYAGHFITRVLEVAGVEEWDKLKGKTIRVKSDYGGVYAIGHIIKDDWFAPKEDFEKLKKVTE